MNHTDLESILEPKSKSWKKAQLIEFHDAATVIAEKFHNEFVGWYPDNPARILAEHLYAKVVAGVLSVSFYFADTADDHDQPALIEQQLTFKGSFTVWW